jgi:TRAP-type mannitol/chloroaromatic compound transport system permease small subunit
MFGSLALLTGLLAISRLIDAINTFVGRWISWLVLVAVLVSATNAVIRKVFNMSSNGWLELQWYLFSAVFLLAAGYTLLTNDHVKVDLVYQRVSRRTQLWIDILGTIFFLIPFCVVSIALSWPIVAGKIANGEVSNNPGGLILWPVWAFIPLGMFLLLIQGFSELIKRIAIMRGVIPDPVTTADAAAAAL